MSNNRFEIPAHFDFAEEGKCLVCSRNVNPKRGWEVNVVDGGATLLAIGETNDDPRGEMGWWTVGSECAKHVPLAFRKRIGAPIPQPAKTAN